VSSQLYALPATLPRRRPWYPLNKKLAGPITGLDLLEKRKFPDIYIHAIVFASTFQYIIAVYSLMLFN
jgi:hypothetical protein